MLGVFSKNLIHGNEFIPRYSGSNFSIFLFFSDFRNILIVGVKALYVNLLGVWGKVHNAWIVDFIILEVIYIDVDVVLKLILWRTKVM